jgi:SAM-dependent methyltransferase
MNFSKQFFQDTWGEDGYYEHFSYGIGIDKVCSVAMDPFFSLDKTALEIGPGGGVFTQRMVNNFKHLIAIDVIRKPKAFEEYQNFTYIELEDRSFDCPVESNSIDYCFSYGCFCHLSNDALVEYFTAINKALKKGADFMFMLSNYPGTLGECLPVGHFVQGIKSLDIIVGEEWEIVNKNLLPEHRDLMVHLRKI